MIDRMIILDENTKEITTVKKVWVRGLNLHKLWLLYFFVFSAFNDQFEKLYQTLQRAFHQVSNHFEAG